MSPAALTPPPSFQVLPLIKTKDQQFNFGAHVEGLDIEEISGMKVVASGVASPANNAQMTM